MLVLASASPRRLELLARVGVEPVVRPPDIDERPRPGEAPRAYVARVAADKARACPRGAGEWVLAADTIVELDGVVLGKAADDAEAAAMLGQLLGRTHTVTTAVCLLGPDGAHPLTVTSEVDMIAAGPADVAAYVASGEWRGKAGAYAVQGIAAALVRAIRGSVTNVIGLPLAEVVELLRATGAAEVAFHRGRPA
ncbi:MAG: septum formation protein Maf [Kofleriaceae bacterium]|nr:septum formation protein Maf [Kofleriaceae bacterium]MCL4228101.1 septum formation protein Maf [Myxococcales bacterium]